MKTMTNALLSLDMEKTLEEILSMNKKLLQGIDTLLSVKEVDVDLTPKELIYEEDKMKLYHYRPVSKKVIPVPVLVVYALVNRQYMMDLQQNRSVIRNWLELGLDVYIIDWGYPDRMDQYLTMEDYIDGYINNAVDEVRRRCGQDKINLLGVCQGGTFSTIYAALYPEKVRNLAVMVSPVDFSSRDGLLFTWSKHLNVDHLVDTYKVIPGEFMNVGFLMLKPFQLTLDKYMVLLENLDSVEVVQDFLRMEKWIFDSPGQAGEAFRKFIKELYQENLLIQNKLELGGRRVDLKNIEMPLLNIFAEQDHLVPPSASRPLNDAVSSKDKQMLSFSGGHIGLFVSSKSQKEVAPTVVSWFRERSEPEKKENGRKKE